MRPQNRFVRPGAASVLATVLAVAAALAVGRAAPASPASLPTTEELEKMVAAKQYQQATDAAHRILGLRPHTDLADGYRMLRVYYLAETSELNAGHYPKAATLARACAAAAWAKDEVNAGYEAMALACLIERSPRGTYAVRSGSDVDKAFDVCDPAARQAAYPYLLADEIDALKEDKLQADSGTSLKPLLASAAKFVGVRAVERVATGETAQTDGLAHQAATVARQLIDAWLHDRDGDLNRAAADAAVVVVRGHPAFVQGRVRHQAQKQVLAGLNRANRALVTTIFNDAGAIDGAVSHLNAAFAVPEAFTGVHEPAVRLKRQAEALLRKYP